MEENKESKVPIYKKWWFWFVLILLLFTINGIKNDNKSKTLKTSSTTTNITTTNTDSNTNTNTNSTTNTTEPASTDTDTTIDENDDTTPAEENITVETPKKEVTVTNFSKMSKKEAKKWCDKNNIECNIEEEYSSKVKKGSFISQSIKAKEKIAEGDEITITYSLGRKPTLGDENALKKAYSYLDYTSFSYKSLIEQLEYEGFSKSEATYGADNCGADWYEQAAKKAKSYMSSMSFSKSGLIEQLEYEGFTRKQAQYGAKSVGY